MKRNRRRLPVPQHEFGFTVDTFRLFSESALDGERLARERAEAECARSLAEQAQARLFVANSKVRSFRHPKADTKTDTK
jgi:hypothetical protein